MYRNITIHVSLAALTCAVEEERLGGRVPDVLEHGLVRRRIAQRDGHVLVPPGVAAVALCELGQARRLVVSRGGPPHVVDASNLRVGPARHLVGLAQVEDAAHVGRDPGQGVGVLAGVLQGAAAEDAAGGDVAAGHGADVAGVDERLGRHEGRRGEDGEERLGRDGVGDAGLDEGVELGGGRHGGDLCGFDQGGVL